MTNHTPKKEGVKMICKNCGKQVPGSAGSCPHCGAPTAKSRSETHATSKLGTVFIFVICAIVAAFLFLMIVSISRDQKPDPDSDSEPPTDSTYETVPNTVPLVYEDRVEMDGVTVILIRVVEVAGVGVEPPKEGNRYVVCEFEIENNQDTAIAVSATESFTVCQDGQLLQLNTAPMADFDSPKMDGTIAPGQKMRGLISYEVSSSWTELTIQFAPEFWDGKEVKFVQHPKE